MKKNLKVVLPALVLVSISSTVFAVTQADVFGKVQQILDGSAQSAKEQKMATIDPTIAELKQQAITEIQAELDKNKQAAATEVLSYIDTKVAEYKSQVDQIKNTNKNDLDKKKKEAVDKQKAQIDQQFAELEADLYESLDASLK